MIASNITKSTQKEAGFTLIELSIVLVIIGLIVGGVLVGQDLIRAAEVRAQISQIEKYNTAVNTFRGKFNAIPGDMSASTASTFGFTAGTNCDGSAAGKRDGNGLIDGSAAASGTVLGTATIGSITGYEAGLFWQDLSSSQGGNLIDGSISNINCSSTTVASGSLAQYFPPAKIGRGQYMSVFNFAGYNYYGLFGFTSVSSGLPVSTTSPMSVVQAYNIDKKMDDGLASTGNVAAMYITVQGNTGYVSAPPNNATAGPTYCFESTGGTYNVGQNNGGGSYCALGFRHQ